MSLELPELAQEFEQVEEPVLTTSVFTAKKNSLFDKVALSNPSSGNIQGGIAITDEISKFSDDQVDAAVRLKAEGLTDNVIAMACGIDQNELALMQQDVRFVQGMATTSSEIHARDITMDVEWTSVEDLTLASLKADVQSGSDMSPMEKLAIAKAANAAKRRRGALAESGRNRGGVLNGDGNVGGNVTTINMNMPTMLLQRMQKIQDGNGAILDAEMIEQHKFETTSLDAITIEDVQDVFDVDLKNTDNVDSPVLSDVLGSVLDNSGNTGLGISEVEG